MSEPDRSEHNGRALATRGGWVVPFACALALLHFGRPVLEPLAVAGILTLTLAPLARRVRALGLGHAAATFVSVGLVGACIAALALILASQMADVIRELPHYRAAVATKIDQLGDVVVRPLERWEAEMSVLWSEPREPEPASGRGAADASPPIAVEIRRPHPDAGTTISRLFGAVWGPVGEAAIVLVLLFFMMLGRDSIRERLVRLTGEKEIARTMQALADTDDGISRFFASLLVMNVGFGAMSWIVLALLGVPHAVLWGALLGAMRFVPYVGVPSAIAAVAVFAAAVDPGWSLALWSAVVLAALEVVVANVLEPQVYGHSMGIAPFGIVAAALFWGVVWGPVGLVVSAPLTLCLVVAGRHVSALAPIAILFGDSPGTTPALRLYQRALAGDTHDVLDDARAYVRRNGLVRYFDDLLLPAFALGASDMRAGRIDRRQDEGLRALLVNLVESLRVPPRSRRRPSLTEASMGAQLRKMREARGASAKGSRGAQATRVLCAGLATEGDEVLTELLVRALRDADLDASALALETAPSGQPPGDMHAASVVLLTYPAEDAFEEWRRSCAALRARLPDATFAAVRPPDGTHAAIPPESEIRADVHIVLHSFSEAVNFASGSRAAEELRAAA